MSDNIASIILQLEEILDDLIVLSGTTDDDPRLVSLSSQLRILANQIDNEYKHDPEVLKHYDDIKERLGDDDPIVVNMGIWLNRKP